ncbi:MAG: sugar ABC transporter permease [Tissierellia bacterium]|nr:sugar ABC transporter permease [Tissierellia bacterium]
MNEKNEQIKVEDNIDFKKKNSIKEKLLNIFSNYSMIIILAFVLIIFQILTKGVLFRPLNVTNLILQNSHTIVLSIGMLLVVLLGHVDLSVGSVVAVVGAVASIIMIKYHVNPILGVIISLAIGALIGAWNGFWIAYVGIPAFIVTIAGMLLFRGITQILLQGTSIAGFPESFQYISTGYLPNIGGSSMHITSIIIALATIILIVASLYNSRKVKIKNEMEVGSFSLFILKCACLVIVLGVLTYLFASYEGFPFVLIIIVLLAGFYSFLTQRMVTGRHIYATGGSIKSAELSGIKTKKITFLVFVNMGLLAALAGLILASRLNAATPQAGVGLETDALSAVYFGGASTSGGIGTISGTIIGGLIMGILNNGMSIIGIGVDWQQGIRGLILLLAVVLDKYNQKRKTN